MTGLSPPTSWVFYTGRVVGIARTAIYLNQIAFTSDSGKDTGLSVYTATA